MPKKALYLALAVLVLTGLYLLIRPNAALGPDNPADEVATPPSMASSSTSANTTENVESSDPTSKLTGTQPSPATKSEEQIHPSVSGLVVDPQGKPVAGAQVVLVGKDEDLRTRSDAHGQFSLQGVPLGKKSLYATKGDQLSFDAADKRHKLEILEDTLSIGPIKLTLLPARKLIVHVVESESGFPIAGAFIRVQGMGESQQTNEKGQVEIVLTHEIWQLSAWADGFERRNLQVAMMGSGPRNLKIALSPGVTVFGRVTDETGSGIGSTTISLSTQKAKRYFGQTEDDGSYEITNVVRNETLELLARNTAYERVQMKDIKVPEDASRFQLNVTFQSGKIDQYALSGTITNLAQEPVAGATISIGWGPDALIQKSNANGHYRFENVRKQVRAYQGERVSVQATGYIHQATFIQNLSDGTVQDFILHPGVTFAGHVFNQQGEAVAGVWLGDQRQPGSPSVTTDVQGYFELEGANPKSSLTAKKKGYGQTTVEVKDQQDAEIILKEGHEILGRVVDTSGEPITHFQVSVDVKSRRVAHYPHPVQFQSDTGHFRIPNLDTDSKANLTIEADGFPAGYFTDVQAAPQSQGERESFVLGEGRRLAGHLLRTDGDPLANVPIHLALYKGRRARFTWVYGTTFGQYDHRTTHTDRLGAFAFEDVPETEMVMYVNEPGFARTAWDDLLERSDIEQMRLTLPKAATLTGLVNLEVYPEGRMVRLQGSNSLEWFETEVDMETGQYEMERLPPLSMRAILKTSPRARNNLVIESADLEEGTATQLNFGFDDYFKVYGTATQGGAPPTVSKIYLLVGDGFTTPLEAILEPNGYFQFDKVPNGTHSLVLHQDGQVNSPLPLSYLLSKSSNKKKIQVADDDVSGQWDFERFGRIYGRIVHQDSVRELILAESNKMRHGKATSGVDGRFEFKDIAPGTYQLYRTNMFDQVLLRDHIEMPADGSDLDIGDIVIEESGSLKIQVQYQTDKKAQTIDVTLSTPEGQQAYHSLGLLNDDATTLDDLPAGNFQLKLAGPNKAWNIVPAESPIELIADTTTYHTVTAMPTTYFTVFAAGKEFSNITMRLEGDGSQITFANTALDERTNTWFRKSYGVGKDIAPGTWTLIATFVGGEVVEKQLVLVNGKAERVVY